MQTKGGNRNRFIVNTALKRLGWKSRFLRKSNDSNSATHLHIYGISISSLTVEEDSLEAFVHSPKTKFAQGLPSCQSHRIVVANFKFDRTDNDTIGSSFYLFDELIISKSVYYIYIYTRYAYIFSNKVKDLIEKMTYVKNPKFKKEEHCVRTKKIHVVQFY